MSNLQLQNINVSEENNPLDTKIVTVAVRKGEHILSKEIYVKEMYDMYNKYLNGCSNADYEKTRLMESTKYDVIVKGDVFNFDEVAGTAHVQVSPKYSVKIDVNEHAVQYIKNGEKIDLSIYRKCKKFEPVADASSTLFRKKLTQSQLLESIQTEQFAFEAVVKSVIRNFKNEVCGLSVDVSGVKCFIPLSEIDVVLVNDACKYIGQSMYVIPLSADNDKDIVVSHRKYLLKISDNIINDLLKSGKETDATIVSVKSFGIIVNISECITAMLPETDMNDDVKKAFNDETITEGSTIKVILDYVYNDKIYVTQLQNKLEDWEDFGAFVSVQRLQNKTEYTVVETNIIKRIKDGYILSPKGFNAVMFFINDKFIDKNNGTDIKLQLASVNEDSRSVRIYKK